MPTNYTVVEGDHISRIAEKFKFYDYTIIWDDGANAALKGSRDNPHILNPGDVVVIPDKTPKKEARPTTNIHKFKVQPQPLQLRLLVLDFDGNPADVEIQWKTEGESGKLALSGGLFRKPILRSYETGHVSAEKLNIDVPMKIGWLDPADYQSGQMARLNNLGYNAGEIESPDAGQFQSAVEEFQCDNGLDVTGVCDEDTRAKLVEVHCC